MKRQKTTESQPSHCTTLVLAFHSLQHKRQQSEINVSSVASPLFKQVLNASGLPATFPRQFVYFTVDIRDK